MVKIKSEDLKIMIPVVSVFLIMLAVTIIYPKYDDIWNLLFWIGILYMGFKTLSDSNAKSKFLKEILNEIHISVKATFTLAIIIGLFEVFFGDHLLISTALMVLAIIFDIIFSRKKDS